MNRTAIEWVHPDPKRRFTWNPLTGCLTGCPYCYARKMMPRWKRSFEPTFYPERLDQPAKLKTPSGIFVVSMGDLFGPWVPAEWQSDITRLPWDVPRHTYYWLTKHPEGLKPFRFGDNSRVGVTVTGPGDLYRQHVLQSVACRVRFVSYEPLLAPVEMGRPMPGLPHWIIVGALTNGHGHTMRPEQGGTRREWVESLVAQADQAGVPVFLKNNLAPLFPGERLRQEWPHA